MNRVKRAKHILSRLNKGKRGCGKGKKGQGGRCVTASQSSPGKKAGFTAGALGVSAVGIGLFTLLSKAKSNPVKERDIDTEDGLTPLTEQEKLAIPKGMSAVKQDEQSLYVMMDRHHADVVLKIKEKLDNKEDLDENDWSDIFTSCSFHCQSPTTALDIKELNKNKRGGSLKEEHERYEKERKAWADNIREILNNPQMSESLRDKAPHPDGEFDYVIAKINLSADLPDPFFSGNKLDLYDGFQSLSSIAKDIEFSEIITGDTELPIKLRKS